MPQQRKLDCPICNHPRLTNLSDHSIHSHNNSGKERKALLRRARFSVLSSPPYQPQASIPEADSTPTQFIPPKIARQSTNIIEPAENEKFLSDIEQQELTDMLNTQVGFGLSQMPSTPPPPSSPPPVNNIDPRQQEFERFFHSEKP